MFKNLKRATKNQLKPLKQLKLKDQKEKKSEKKR